MGIPVVRAVCKDFVAETKRAGQPLDHDRLVAAVDALFASDFHELRSAGIGLLERCRAALSLRDLPWLVSLVRASPGWAHVDWLATKVAGPLLQDTPKMAATLRAWANDENFWVRRTAILSQTVALRTGGGDFELFESIAVPMLKEREFFIRKAIGWVLRDTAKVQPGLVRGFIERHESAMSGLTLREASRGLAVGAARAATPAKKAGARSRKGNRETPRSSSA